MQETAFAAAFQKAGFETGPDRLAVAATNCLSRFGNDPGKAVTQFERLLNNNHDLLRALALSYLHARAADIRGDRLAGAALINGDGPSCVGRSSQLTNPRDERGGDAQMPIGNQGLHGIPEHSAADRSASAVKGHLPLGPSAAPQDDGEVPYGNGSRDDFGLPVSVVRLEQTAVRDNKGRFFGMPTQARKSAALRVMSSVSNSLFDAYRLQDGVSIGKVHWFELDKRIEKGTRDTALLRMIRDRGKPSDTYSTIEEIITIDDLDMMVKTVAEMSNAA